MNDIRAVKSQIFSVAKNHGVLRIRVFGSVARGDSKDSSDVDLLVRLEEGRSGLDLGGFLMDVQDILQCHVDVVTENGLHDYIKESVLKEAVDL